MIFSIAVVAATYSDPKVAVLTVACFLEYQLIGVLFIKCKMHVTDFLTTSGASGWNPHK